MNGLHATRFLPCILLTKNTVGASTLCVDNTFRNTLSVKMSCYNVLVHGNKLYKARSIKGLHTELVNKVEILKKTKEVYMLFVSFARAIQA